MSEKDSVLTSKDLLTIKQTMPKLSGNVRSKSRDAGFQKFYSAMKIQNQDCHFSTQSGVDYLPFGELVRAFASSIGLQK